MQLSEVPVGEVHEAANGKEALAVMDAHDVDALFTDINMPVMSGPELLRELERQGRAARRRASSCRPMDRTRAGRRCRAWRSGTSTNR